MPLVPSDPASVKSETALVCSCATRPMLCFCARPRFILRSKSHVNQTVRRVAPETRTFSPFKFQISNYTCAFIHLLYTTSTGWFFSLHTVQKKQKGSSPPPPPTTILVAVPNPHPHHIFKLRHHPANQTHGMLSVYCCHSTIPTTAKSRRLVALSPTAWPPPPMSQCQPANPCLMEGGTLLSRRTCFKNTHSSACAANLLTNLFTLFAQRSYQSKSANCSYNHLISYSRKYVNIYIYIHIHVHSALL